jgi:hypothetical protein
MFDKSFLKKVSIRFIVKLKKTTIENYEFVREVCGQGRGVT